MSAGATPRVRGNDWSVLDAPALDSYTPHRTVSVVVPAYQAQQTLPYTLAALAAQSYPSDLLEVVVVDDGDEGSLDLPDLRPENTRVVRSSTGWGAAHARDAGATATEGEVLHWLDADMVPERDHVAHQMKWHHVSDHVVVLGHKIFVDTVELPSVDAVHEAVRSGRLADLLADRRVDQHDWVEHIWDRTDELRGAGFRAFHVHVGATGSVARALYHEAGGMDTSLKFGEDIELGYRLAMRGAVFVGERAATGWHLGHSNLMQRGLEVQRYQAPFVAQRVPDFRKFREDSGRTYRVPFIEVVVDAEGHAWDEVKFTVDGVMQARPADLVCLVVGRWGDLDQKRRHPLQDELLEERLILEEYANDARVTFIEKLPGSAFPVQFRLHLPAGWRPGTTTLENLTREMQRRSQGLRQLLLPDGLVVRLERTAAFERAVRTRREGEDLDDAIDAVSETRWSSGEEAGFTHHSAELVEPEPGPPSAHDAAAADSTAAALVPVGGRRSFFDLLGPLRRR